MSTRFHDKWHGANHNSVSAIGIPDAGRDPIASKVFPFEGEFIMNNSPRNNGGDGHSEFSPATIFNDWILSSNRIDSDIIRSQQDDPTAEIVLSAQCDAGNRVVQTLHGTDNTYRLEVSGADNYETFDCSYDATFGTNRHKADKSIGVAGESIYTQSINANVPLVEETLYAKDGHIPPVPVNQKDSNSTSLQERAAGTEPSYNRIIKTTKDANAQLVELRVTDTNGYLAPLAQSQLLRTVDCVGINGQNHNAYLDIGKVRIDANANGDFSTSTYATNEKQSEVNRISMHGNETDGRIDICRHTGSNGISRLLLSGSDGDFEIARNLSATIKEDCKTWVGGDVKSVIEGNYDSEIQKNDATRIRGSKTVRVDNNLNCGVSGRSDYEGYDFHTKADELYEVSSHSAILMESDAESTYRSNLNSISIESPRGGIYLNGSTSIKPHGHTHSTGHEIGTELATDRLVVSAYSTSPLENWKDPITGNDIWFEDSNGRVPNLNTTHFRAEKAFIHELTVFSGNIQYVDIQRSDASGFDITGIDNTLTVPGTIPVHSRLYLTSAGLWNDRWMYTSGDATFGSNVAVKGVETVDRKITGRTSVEIGDSLGTYAGDKIGGKYALYTHGSVYVDEDLDVRNNISGNGNLEIDGNARIAGTVRVGDGLTGQNPTALEVKHGVATFEKSVSAHGQLTVDGESVFNAQMHAQNISANGHVSARDYVAAPEFYADQIITDGLSTSTITSQTDLVSVNSDFKLANNFGLSAAYIHATGYLSANRIVTPSGVWIGVAHPTNLRNENNLVIVANHNTLSYNNSQDSILISQGTNNAIQMINATNCIGIGNVRFPGGAASKENTILIGNGTTTQSNLLQFHNVPFFRFDPSLSTGKLEDTLYSFYDYRPNDPEHSVFNFANASAISLSANKAQITEANLGHTEIHDGLRVIGSSGLYVQGNASAYGFYIMRSPENATPFDGAEVVVESVPLSTYIDETVEKSLETRVDALTERMARSVVQTPVAYEPEMERRGADSEIVALAEQVDEAEHVSYVFSAEKIENYCPQRAETVSVAQTVFNANTLKTANSVGSATNVKTAEYVDSFISAGSVQNAGHVDAVETVGSVKAVSAADRIASATSVESANSVANAVEIYSGTEVVKTDFVQRAESVKRAKTVEVAENVKAIKLLDGNTLRGPAASRVLRCDSEIPVSEWVDYYKTTSTDISLKGSAVGWSEEDYDLVFTVRFVPPEETLYSISISADRDINWIGTNGTAKKFKAPVSVNFRISKDEITAKLEA